MLDQTPVDIELPAPNATTTNASHGRQSTSPAPSFSETANNAPLRNTQQEATPQSPRAEPHTLHRQSPRALLRAARREARRHPPKRRWIACGTIFFSAVLWAVVLTRTPETITHEPGTSISSKATRNSPVAHADGITAMTPMVPPRADMAKPLEAMATPRRTMATANLQVKGPYQEAPARPRPPPRPNPPPTPSAPLEPELAFPPFPLLLLSLPRHGRRPAIVGSESSMLLTLAWNQWVLAVLMVLFLLICGLVILTVLVQPPQGGGLAGAFGGGSGSGQTAFGTKTGDALTVLTISMFVVYLLAAIALNYGTRRRHNPKAPAVIQSTEQPAPGAGEQPAGTPTEAPATTPPAPADAPAGSQPPAGTPDASKPAEGTAVPATPPATPATGEAPAGAPEAPKPDPATAPK